MRDVRVYDREISGSEIVDLYNIGAVDIKDAIEFEALELPEPNIYLKMQEGVGSSVLNYGNNIKKTGTLTNAEYIFYKNKSCIDFTDATDVLSFNANTNLSNDEFTNGLTISMWFNKIQTSGTTYLISKGSTYEFELQYVDDTQDQFKFLFGNGTNNEEWNLDYTITDDEWYHISVTRDIGTANLKKINAYINGTKYSMVKSGSTNYSVSQQGINANFEVARQKGGTYSNIYANNIRIYNSELSEKQIQKIYREELNSSSTLITDNYTSDKIKTIAELRNPENDSDLNDCLVMNLTGRDNGTTTYVNDYSLNRYNAAIATGTLTYTSTDASTIQADVLSFNGSTYLAVDGTLAMDMSRSCSKSI